MHTKIPSLWRILWTDYPSMLSVIAPVIAWLFYLWPSNRVDLTWLLISAGITTVALPVLVWRYFLIRGVFENGEPVQAEVVYVNFYRDRGRVEYTYTYRGQQYRSGNALHKNAKAQRLAVGQDVTVVLDPANPKRAFLKELYLDD